MAAHDLNTYIFTFTKIGLLSPQFSVQRPAFLKAVFQCESFDVGLIRVGESPEVRVMVLSRLIHLFRTHINHCVFRLYLHYLAKYAMELRAKKVSLTVHILELNHIVMRRFSILQSKYQFQKNHRSTRAFKVQIDRRIFYGSNGKPLCRPIVE